MGRLRRSDLESILEFLLDAAQMFDRPYPATVVARLGELVPSADLVYRENDLRARCTPVMVGRSGSVADDDDDRRYWSVGPCPITLYRAATGDLAALRLSDVTDRRRYAESPMYRDYFAPYGVEYLVDVGLPAGPGRLRSLLFCRRREDGDFSERDRDVLEALRPHLARLEAEAALRRKLADLLRAESLDEEPEPWTRLTTREREVIGLVREGMTNAGIAARLGVAPSTVKKHLENTYEKLGVGRRTAAAHVRFR